MEEDKYTLTRYRNNVNAGTASFNMEGVFPSTIGRKTYTFKINPQPLDGTLILTTDSFIYSGSTCVTGWRFSEEKYVNLLHNKDYTFQWSDNVLPGTGTLVVTGKGNYTGSITANIFIDKAPLKDSMFALSLPDEDVTYDGLSHGATITKSNGVGDAMITYQKQGETVTTVAPPSEPGSYTIFIEFAEGTLYYGRAIAQVGSFSIYQFCEEEWSTLQTILTQLTEMGWPTPWDMSQGIKSASSLQGLTIDDGHVTGINLAGQNLSGSFPYILLSLPQLKDINLSGNNLSGDIGTATFAVVQQHPEMMANIQQLDISGNTFTGNIGLFANCLPNLKSLDASGNCLEDVYPTIPLSVTALDISRQTINRVVPFELAGLSADSIASKLPTVLLYDHANQTFSGDIALSCTTSDNAWSVAFDFRNSQLSISCISEQNEYHGGKGDTLNVSVTDRNSSSYGSTIRVTLNFDDGDGNFDGNVNVLDLQTILNYMFEDYADKPYNYTATDLWKDEIINVQDAVCMVNLLLDAAEPVAYINSAVKRVMELQADSEASVFVADGSLTLYSSKPVSSFDIVVATDQKCEVVEMLTDAGFTCAARQNGNLTHIVGYSLAGAELPAGQTVICRLDEGTVKRAMLADKDAGEISVSLNAVPTDIQSSQADKAVNREVYRIHIDANHSIIIDSNGEKYLIKDEK